ncbi:hypothetical protein MPTK1_2g21310 [Marchantia polymorpha subsp. ruderalis]|uniref:Uncharacterized protein n=1 Tax=Marchantia polymorpha TaxID=3197 RepID=A0A2R6X2V3_MARPO|nr:hypothetical protein MARPO_0040s0083 [Marchantia polymorpha]BBN03166.1 hypothetical protein Mp_2g21310 [Marchantia polymorpha subsp. ruderalis]|eukprot:PTQ40411.1 hypothetical protein MARPO_0040s0083 [Marchantia polymorpha]
MQGIVSSPVLGFSCSRQFGPWFESFSGCRYGSGKFLHSNVRVSTGSYGPGQLSQRALRRRVQRSEGNVGRRTVQCRNQVQSLQLDFSETEQLQQCLSNIYNAMGLQDYSLNQHIVVSGKQFLMNMEGQWSLIWCMDGRFYERYDGPELNFEWAYDGNQSPWSADAAGRVSILDLDDREVCLMASWVRTGYWLTEDGRKQLSISIEPQKGGPFSKETVFALHLKNSKVMAYLVVDNSNWLPARLSIKAFGSEDKWEYRDWQLIQPGYSSKFPMAITHNPPAGGRDLYSVTSIKVEIPGEELADAEISEKYAFPDSSLVPRSTHSYPKTHIDNNLPPTVKMYHAESGHYLVRPLIDGKDIGYFIVDTGASSLTITSEKAEELDMYAFGEAYVTGVEGEVKCQFRRAKSFQIGPLTIEEPIFMEVPMAGVVRGISPVAGICGYDIFFHCTVEMSYKMGTLSFFDTYLYNKASKIRASQWQSMYMLENVPHVPAYFMENEAIFLLDTGAGGVDIIFHGRAVEKFRLNQTLELAGTASVKGINTSGKGLQVQYGILDSLEVAGQSFNRVKALFPAKGTCGSLDFSEYTAGVLCGDLLTNLLVVLDYGNRRFALIQSRYVSSRSRI